MMVNGYVVQPIADFQKRYPIQLSLGQGSYGEVSLVRSGDKYRVVKRIYALFGIDDLPDIAREFQLARDLGKCGIAPKVYETEFVKDDDDIYSGMIIMERLGMDLTTFLDKCKHEPPHWRQNLQLLISNMANMDILCLDMKPSNVMVDVIGCLPSRIRLIDFGVFCQNTEMLIHFNNLPSELRRNAYEAIMLMIMDANLAKLGLFKTFRKHITALCKEKKVKDAVKKAMNNEYVQDIIH